MRLAEAEAAMDEEQAHLGIAFLGEALRRLEGEFIGRPGDETGKALRGIRLAIPQPLQRCARVPLPGALLGSGTCTAGRGSGAPKPGFGSDARGSATVISRLTNSLLAAAKARSMRVT